MRNYVLQAVTLAVAAGMGCSPGASGATDSSTAQPNAAVTAIDSSASVDRGAPASGPERTQPRTDGRRTIVFAGTSLTAGMGLDPDSAYPQLIQPMIDSAGLKYTVVNAGVSGETSSALLARMSWLLRQPIDVFVVETGANDGLRGIPVATMRSNIAQVIARVRTAHPDARIALVQMEAPPNLGATYTRDFRESFPMLARAHGVTLLPFLLDGVAGVRELNQGDGIHPNMAGERIVARNVWRALRPLLQ